MLRRQLLDSSRGRIVGLLRRGALTADDLARELQLTRSAVRSHMAAMERDSVVRRAGRRPGATRPSQLFELTADVQQLLSTAYIPFLIQLVDVFAERLPARQLEAMLRLAGKRLAIDLLGGKRPTGPLVSRAAMASEMLNEHLGALTHVESNGRHVIHGVGCPLSALTGKHRGVCRAVETLVSEIVGVPVKECCDRFGRPHCCFEIRSR